MDMLKPTILFTPDDLTTVLEATKYLDVHFTTVYRWIKKGVLHPVHIAGQDYLSIDEVKTLKEKRDGESHRS